MDIYFLIFGVLLILFLVKKVSAQIKQRKLYKLESLIREEECQEIDLEDIIVEGFHYSEHVAVDVYDNKIDDKKYTDYSNPYQLSNKFHKDKEITKFYSTLKLDFNFEEKSYKLSGKIPLDEVTLRMSFLQQKRGKIFIEKEQIQKSATKTKKIFYLDLEFLDHESVRFLNLKTY
ncbi:hypothetical protein [Tenacibaculum agarivorans]|uniref:hypothetical protein n=1 Tax=Tenacibaculum agarivorans TaxID=1908389 RepID=UPI00094BA816|nr:hypothetical protein [Tenacibaculum agarivorans]